MKTKIQILFALALCLAVSSQGGMENPNREIPVPKQTVLEAINLVQAYYGQHGGDPEKIIISVFYGRPRELRKELGNNFVSGDESESSWFVTYTHPKKGDSNVVYRLRSNGEIYSLIQTRNMNPKLLLGLALVFSGGLFGCSATGQAMTIKVTTKTVWTARTNALYSLSGTVRVLNTKESVYTFQIASGQTFDIPAAVLVNNTTKNVYVGRKAEFYIETDSGIAGIRLDGGVLQWDSGLIAKLKPGETLEDVVHRFETEVDHLQLRNPPTQWVEIGRVLNPWFFTNPPGSSRSGGAIVKKFAVNNGELQLDLESPTGIYKASIWIDIKTRDILKAIEDGQQVFPR